MGEHSSEKWKLSKKYNNNFIFWDKSSFPVSIHNDDDDDDDGKNE